MQANVKDTMDNLFAISLQDYQATEQRWLALQYALQSGDNLPSADSRATTAKDAAKRLYSAARTLAASAANRATYAAQTPPGMQLTKNQFGRYITPKKNPKRACHHLKKPHLE